MNKRWIDYFFDVCKVTAKMSKDPSTKVGAVIVDGQRRIVSVGFNGFARGCDDAEEFYLDRAKKYSRMMHAELGAILHAQRDLSYCSLFVYPFPPCDRCAAAIIQSGIGRVYCPPLPEDAAPRWAEAVNNAREMFREACVLVYEVKHV